MPSELIITGLPQPQGFAEDPLYYFTRVYLVFLQGLFKAFPEGSYRWSVDEKLSEITITDQCPLPGDRLDQRPAIVTMRGPAQRGNISLDSLERVNLHTGERRHTDLIACTMTINCIAKMGLEAQRISWAVMDGINTHNRLLQRQGGMHQVGNQLSISSESPPGAFVTPTVDEEFTMITVQSPFFFKWTKTIVPLDAPKANIEAHMTAMLGPLDTTGVRQQTVLRQPTIRGVRVKGTSIPLDRSTLIQTVKP